MTFICLERSGTFVSIYIYIHLPQLQEQYFLASCCLRPPWCKSWAGSCGRVGRTASSLILMPCLFLKVSQGNVPLIIAQRKFLGPRL